MLTVTYTFIKNHPNIILKKLNFEGDGSGIAGNTGSVQRDITGKLNINVVAEGSLDAIGTKWSLIVKVNGNPIITDDGTGVIRKAIGNNGKSVYDKPHSWF